MSLKESPAIRGTLYVSCDDVNHKSAIKQLTDDELLYCLFKEDRKTGIKQLRSEARKRGINPDEVVRCVDCETFDDPCPGRTLHGVTEDHIQKFCCGYRPKNS